MAVAKRRKKKGTPSPFVCENSWQYTGIKLPGVIPLTAGQVCAMMNAMFDAILDGMTASQRTMVAASIHKISQGGSV